MFKVCKSIFSVITVVLFTVMVSVNPIFPVPTVSAETITVQNNSFENEDTDHKPLNWVVVTSDPGYIDEASVSIDRSYQGVKSLKIEDNSNNKAVGVRSSDINAAAGTFYEGKAYCYISSGTASFYIEFWNDTGTRLDEHHVVLNTTGSWQQVIVSGTAPEGTSKLTLLCYSTVANIGKSYFDLVSLDNLGYLMPNGDMESGYANGQPLEWEFDLVNGTENGYLSDKYKHNGSHSVCLDDSSTSISVNLRSPYFKASAGQIYTGNCYVYNESGAGWFYIEFWDANKTRISETHVISSGTGSWQKLTVTATAPANTVAVTLLVYSSMGNSGKCYFDDISIEGCPMKYAYYLSIASNKQFFADNYIIEHMSNITRTMNPGTKHGSAIIVPEYGWEGVGTNWPSTYLYGTVIYDNEASIYKMWYQAYYDPTATYYVCYATSFDGINWTKPNLGVWTFNGNTNNNIVGTQQVPSVYKDMQESDPNKRYKMYAFKGPCGSPGDGYYIWYSPDGINWSQPYSTPRIDSADVCTMTYDTSNSKYISGNKFVISHPDGKVRRIQMTSSSTNFIDWNTPKTSFVCDAEDAIGYLRTDIYGMGLFAYEGVYFGFPWMFYHTQDRGASEDGPVNVQLAFSRDASHWVRPSRTAVIPNGSTGSFDAGSIYTASYPIIVGDEIRLYYGGWTGTHDPSSGSSTGRISYTTWRKDGFVSLDSGSTQGVVLTKILRFTGNKLVLNANASGGGYIKVEILDGNDNIRAEYSKDDCASVTTDNLNHIIQWNGSNDISALAGQDIKLKIYMSNAKLYSFTFMN